MMSVQDTSPTSQSPAQTMWTCLVTSSFLFFILFRLTTIILKVINNPRQNKSREILLNTFCFIQGRKTLWVRDVNIATRILAASHSKGQCIEQLLSTPAWLPIYSLESVEGDQWLRMKKTFLKLRPHLPPLQKLSEVTANIVQTYIDNGKIIDSPTLVRITTHIMCKWLFDQDFKPEWEFVISATEEWRKELAIRGKADVEQKLRVASWIKDLIKDSNYYQIFGEDWENPEYWSLILQPFFISPAINITDIAVSLGSAPYLEKLKQLDEQNPPLHRLQDNQISATTINDYIIYAINWNHPFPILERWLPEGLHDGSKLIVEPNTQVFIPLDDFGSEIEFGNKNPKIAFGAGKRACAGRDIAMSLCVPLFSKLLFHPLFKPAENHLYSGRDNDFNQSWAQSVFQVNKFLSVVWQLLKARYFGILIK